MGRSSCIDMRGDHIHIECEGTGRTRFCSPECVVVEGLRALDEELITLLGQIWKPDIGNVKRLGP